MDFLKTLADLLPEAWRQPVILIIAAIVVLGALAGALKAIVELLERLFRKRKVSLSMSNVDEEVELTDAQRRELREALRKILSRGTSEQKRGVSLLAAGKVQEGLSLISSAANSGGAASRKAIEVVSGIAGEVGRRVSSIRYQPLSDYLSKAPGPVVVLTFSEIEKILKFRLPPSARKHRAWWANEKSGSHSHAQSWIGAGYKAGKIELGGETVEFARV